MNIFEFMEKCPCMTVFIISGILMTVLCSLIVIETIVGAISKITYNLCQCHVKQLDGIAVSITEKDKGAQP